MLTCDELRRFGETVRGARERCHLSQGVAAERAGLRRTYWGGVERGERNPTLKTIFRIAGALGVPASSLLAAGEATGDAADPPTP